MNADYQNYSIGKMSEFKGLKLKEDITAAEDKIWREWKSEHWYNRPRVNKDFIPKGKNCYTNDGSDP